MQFLFLIFGLAGLLTFATGATDTSAAAHNLPLDVVPVIWNGTMGGHEFELTGTVQSVFAQLQALYPELDATNPNSEAYVDLEAHKNLTSRAEQSPDLISRNKDGLLCCPVGGWGWLPCYEYRISEGIAYLNSLGAKQPDASMYIQPGCSRISCSYEAAIWLCNSTPNTLYATPAYLGTFAWDLTQHCLTYPFTNQNPLVCGQEFDDSGFNIIVRADSTNGC